MQPAVKFYGLSTCVHCRHAREFLDSQKANYDLVYVDMLSGDERKNALAQVREYNPDCSFPTIVIGNEVVVGFNPEAISEALNHG